MCESVVAQNTRLFIRSFPIGNMRLKLSEKSGIFKKDRQVQLQAIT